MKEIYIAPSAEFSLVDEKDVIATSSVVGTASDKDIFGAKNASKGYFGN